MPPLVLDASDAHATGPLLEAVLRRDPALDGKIVYAVTTTGIYCRPSCPSPRAKPANIAFFGTPEAAERAGFRPCRRCRPNEGSGVDRATQAVARACRALEAAEETPTLKALADAAGYSAFHFHRLFRRVTGVTPKAYADAARIRRVREGLRGPESVTEALYGAGYGAASRFYEAASGHLGMTPTAYRRGGEGAEIRFAVGACSLGALLVAATPRGICAISLGADPDALVSELQDLFPRARLVGGDPAFEAYMAQVVGLIEAPALAKDLPLDVRGTAFQRQVWEALRRIPQGATATYAEIAAAIGRPTAARAVARACAGNTLAVAIPCHRVVRTDGSLSGYRWGVERKKALLDRERAAS